MPEAARVAREESASAASEPWRDVERPREPRARPTGLHADLLRVQRTAGNRAVGRMIGAGLAPSAPRAPRSSSIDRSIARAPARAAPSEPVIDLPVRRAPAPSALRVQRFDIPFTDYETDFSIEGVKTAAGVVRDTAEEALDWIVDKIRGLVDDGIEWLKEKARAIEEMITSGWQTLKGWFSNIVAFVKNPFGFLADALMRFDGAAIERAWKGVSSLITSVADKFKALADGILGTVDGLWSRIDGFATSLLARVEGMTDSWVFRKLPGKLQQIAHGLIDSLKSVWKTISDAWKALFGPIKQWIDDAIDAVFAFVRKIASVAINVVISGLVMIGQVALFLKDLVGDPGKYIDILAQKSVAAFDGVESRFEGLIRDRFGGDAKPEVDTAGAATTRIHRSPGPGAAPAKKGSATWSQIGHGVLGMMGKKWEEFKANPLAVVKQLVMDMVFPIVGNIQDIVQLFKDVKKVLFGPLSAGSLEELWTSILQILDIPIMIYHTVVSILMRTLMLPLIVASFVPHPIVKGIAAAVGYALLAAFVQAEGLNLAQKLLLLKTGSTTQEQKQEAYNRIADSLIALAMTAVVIVVMLILHFIANVMKGVYNFVKGKVFAVEPAPAVEAKGPKPAAEPAEQPKVDTPEPKVETPEAIDGERVVGEKTTADGHKVKVTEEGRCLVCTTCEEIDVRFKDELKVESPEIDAIKKRLEAAREMPNGTEAEAAAKAEAVAKVKEELDAVRKTVRAGEPLVDKAKALDTAKNESKASIDEAEKALDSKEARDLGANEELKKQLNKLRGERGQLDRDWQGLKDKAGQAADDARDPGVQSDAETAKASGEEVDGLRDQLENLRSDAERIKRDVKRLVDEHGPKPEPALTIEPDVPIVRQLEGRGQLADLRANPNLKGVNLEDLLAKTPRELEAMEAAGEITSQTRRTIMKAFEGRDLGGSSTR